MGNLKGRVAVVTGASRQGAIGAAICRELASQGASVFFTHFTAADRAAGYDIGGGPAALLSDLQAQVPAAAMELDLTSQGAAHLVLDRAQAALGPPEILVNNATHCAPSSFRDLTEEVLEQHIAVNVRGTILLAAEFARRCAGRGFGRIVSLVSGQDRSGEPGNLAYGATKGAISAMTRYLAVETAALGITVNAIDPGPTDSGWMDDALRAQIQAAEPSGRVGLPADAAQAVALLCSEQAGFITGQVLVSDGGFSIA